MSETSLLAAVALSDSAAMELSPSLLSVSFVGFFHPHVSVVSQVADDAK